MLGTVGFIAAAVVFYIYGLTAGLSKQGDEKIRQGSFQLAYYLLSIACMVWAIGLSFGSEDALRTGVLLGGICVMAATVALVDAITPEQSRTRVLALLGGLAGAFTLVRAFYFAPQPYEMGGLLVFNSQLPITLVFGALFVAVWLPVNLIVSRRISAGGYVLPLESISAFAFVLATVGVSIFLAARRPSTLVLSFGVLCFAYASLAGVNYLKHKEVEDGQQPDAAE